MIRLIYPVIIQDIESLQSAIKNKGIDVHGVSTFESKENPQTLVFVANTTSNAAKSAIDDEVRIAAKSLPPQPAPDPTKEEEEDVTDETRTLG